MDDATVQLYNATGLLVSTQTTSAGGYYLFTGLAAGDYTVRATPSSTAYVSTVDPAGSADPDSDIEQDDNGNGTATGQVVSGVFTIGPTEPTGDDASTPGHPDSTPDDRSNYSIDFGFYLPPTLDLFSLGNRVFFDDNDNGVRDSAETGVSGVAVRLLTDAGTLVASTTTNPDGYYLFTGLPAGRYTVEVDGPAGTKSSTDIATSANADTDADNDDDGIGTNRDVTLQHRHARRRHERTDRRGTGQPARHDPGQPVEPDRRLRLRPPGHPDADQDGQVPRPPAR